MNRDSDPASIVLWALKDPQGRIRPAYGLHGHAEQAWYALVNQMITSTREEYETAGWSEVQVRVVEEAVWNQVDAMRQAWEQGASDRTLALMMDSLGRALAGREDGDE